MPRKKREVIEHRTFGFGSVKHRKTIRSTETNDEAETVEMQDE